MLPAGTHSMSAVVLRFSSAQLLPFPPCRRGRLSHLLGGCRVDYSSWRPIRLPNCRFLASRQRGDIEARACRAPSLSCHPTVSQLKQRLRLQRFERQFGMEKSRGPPSGARAWNRGVLRASGENGSAYSDEEDDVLSYRMPPPEIAEIVDAPPTPALSFAPRRDKILSLHRPSLAPIIDLAKPELKLAGLRIDPETNTRSRMSCYTGLSMCELAEDGSKGEERPVSGLPPGAKINFCSWSPDGNSLAFTVRLDEEDENNGTGQPGAQGCLALWTASVETMEARELIGPPSLILNTVFDSYSWIDSERMVVHVVRPGREPRPRRSLAPTGPKVQSNESCKVAQARTYQDLLKDRHDEAEFEYFSTSQLLLVHLDGTVSPLGPPRMYTRAEPSPDGRYLLLSYIERPFSYNVPCGRFPKVVEVWRVPEGRPPAGEAVLKVREVCRLPLAEDIPIAFNSVRKGRRGVSWRPDRPAELYWVEAQDEGDPRIDVTPRDIVYVAPPEDNGEEPRVLVQVDLRFGGVVWCDDELALVYESWYKTRRTKTWVISPGQPDLPPRLLFDRSYEDVYSDPGSPMLRRAELGTYLLAKVAGGGAERPRLLLSGSGATAEGNVPFLDLLDVESGEKERLWQSDKERFFESVVAFMSDDTPRALPGSDPTHLGALEPLPLDGLRMLISRESQTEPSQFFIHTFPNNARRQITDFPHPYPQLKKLSKEIIRYKRSDGVDLTATLYLPPGYDVDRDGPLPCLMWAYPREFKSRDTAGQVRGSPNQFAGIGATSPLLWLARGYAILDGPTMPIIGEGEQEANDRYVEQLVMSAQAAVDEVIRRRVAHPARIAVGGHSYGAFMAANLLAHCPDLFACGIARSGAYNRTLTPFGFQAEERTLWEAPEVYMEMSPFMKADKIKKPLLLIHGEDDNNSGTFPMQSERFFSALKGNGAHTRLVVLPYESHGYASRESVLHTLYEMERWLELHCAHAEPVAEPSSDQGAHASAPNGDGAAVAAPTAASDSTVSTTVAAGGGSAGVENESELGPAKQGQRFRDRFLSAL